MFAVFLAQHPPAFGALATLPAALPLAALLIAALRQARPEVRRIVVAVTLAVVLATVAHAAEDPGVVVYSACERYTPADWEWWVLVCFRLPLP